MKKIYQELLDKFKKGNQKSKFALAKKFNFDDPAKFLIFLNNELGNNKTKKDVIVKKKDTIVGKKDAKGKTVNNTEVIPTIHNVYILDVSSSMNLYNKIDIALSGIREEFEALKADKTVNYSQSFITFSSHNAINCKLFLNPINNVKGIPDVIARGQTALYDAIGTTLGNLNKEVKNNEKVLVKIFTDGEENDSVDWNRHSLSSFIKTLQAKNFTITFVGTENDIDNMVDNVGILRSNTLSHKNDATTVKAAFKTSLNSTRSYSDNVKKGIAVTDGFYTKKKGTL